MRLCQLQFDIMSAANPAVCYQSAEKYPDLLGKSPVDLV